jgi:hypothetical protein
MISIVEAISDLLYVRETVVVPGLGAFVKKPVSAKVNPVANYFAMPSSEIVFDANLREDNDLVVNYIVEKFEVSKDEARRELALFVSDCFNSLKQGERVLLNQIGTLYYDGENDLVFKQDDSANYNADAFGLCDFTPEPVLQTKSKEEIRAEIEQQQKEKNTPVTVDEDAVHQKEDKGKGKGKWWIVAVAAGVLLFTVFHFDMIHLGFDAKKENSTLVSQQPKEENPVSLELPNDTIKIEEVVVTDTFRIIAGCYDREEFAEKIVYSLQTKGFEQAFKLKRGDRWFVAYGWYPTEEEAVAVLREIRESGKGKGWILK